MKKTFIISVPLRDKHKLKKITSTYFKIYLWMDKITVCVYILHFKFKVLLLDIAKYLFKLLNFVWELWGLPGIVNVFLIGKPGLVAKIIKWEGYTVKFLIMSIFITTSGKYIARKINAVFLRIHDLYQWKGWM